MRKYLIFNLCLFIIKCLKASPLLALYDKVIVNRGVNNNLTYTVLSLTTESLTLQGGEEVG